MEIKEEMWYWVQQIDDHLDPLRNTDGFYRLGTNQERKLLKWARAQDKKKLMI